jgi:hypothetical protein
MKNKPLLAAALAVSLALSASAQSVTNSTLNASGGTNTVTGPANFFSTAAEWFTTANTGDSNEVWTVAQWELSDGFAQVNGTGAADTVEAQHDWANGLLAGGKATFAGVGSAFNSGEVYGGYSILRYYSVKADADLGIGYDGNTKNVQVDARLMVTKYLTAITTARIGLGEPAEFKGTFKATPTLYVEFGFVLP